MRKLRIMQINFSSIGIGGTEHNLIEHAEQLIKRGHFVLTCSLKEKEGEMAYEFKKRKLPFINLDISSFWNIIRLVKLVKLVRQFHIDIVNLYGLQVQVLTTFLLRLAGVRVILSGLDGTDDWRRGYHIGIESITYPFITKWIAVSDQVKKVFTQREGIPANKIQVIHCSVDTSYLTPKLLSKKQEIRDRLHIPKDIFVIGYTSVLKPYKRHEDLLKALKILKEKGIAFRAIFVGKDRMNGKIQKLSKQMNLDENLLITGYVEDLRDIIPAFDVFVSASLIEGLSVAMLEAMAIGLPVIVTPVGGTLEVIKDGENGIIVPPRNPQLLSEQIQDLIQNRELRALLSQNAVKTIENGFSLTSKIIEREKLYYSILSHLPNRKGSRRK